MRYEYKVLTIDRGEELPIEQMADLGRSGFVLVVRHEYREYDYDSDSGRDFSYPKVQLVFCKALKGEK